MTTGEGTGIALVLPMVPDRRLAPNAVAGRSAWYSAPLVAAERAQAALLARDQAAGRETIAGRVEVDVTIYWGKRLHVGAKRSRVEQDRPLDWDSATTIVKPLCDGALIDSGLLGDDRQIDCGTVRQRIDPQGIGFTEIAIRAVGEGSEA